jgi:uncharacterized membrane protein
MSKPWKIIALLLLFCLACFFVRLFLMERLLDVVIRLLGVLSKLGRK